MSVLNHWLQYLDGRQVRYSHSTHPWARTALDIADAERIRAHDLAKTVVYSGGGGFGMAVVPADQFVDLAEIGRLLGLPHVRLANEAELARLFPDCELGAMPPLGDSCQLPVIVDRGIAGNFIAFAIGTHRDIVRMSFTDFQRLANPVPASVAVGMEMLV